MKSIIKLNTEMTNVWTPNIHTKQEKHDNGKYGIWSLFHSKQCYQKILTHLKKATETIMISSFIIADSQIERILVEKAKEGVRVYLLTSTDVQLRKMEKEDPSAFDNKTINHHIAMLNNFVGNILCRSAEHIHAKFLLIDPITNGNFNPNTIGFISTANFNNDALTIKPEIIVEISKEYFGNSTMDILQSMYIHFISGFWVESEQELHIKGSWTGINPNNGKKTIDRTPNIPHTSKHHLKLKDKILDYINMPAEELIISAYTFDSNHETLHELRNLKSDTKITILSPDREINQIAIKSLANHFDYPKFHVIEKLHAKFILVKQRGEWRSLVFTANFSTLGLDSGYEIGIELGEKQSNQILKISENWKSQSKLVFHKRILSNDLKQYKDNKIRLFTQTGITELTIKEIKYSEKSIELKYLTDLELIKPQNETSNKLNEFIENRSLYLEKHIDLKPKLNFIPPSANQTKDQVKIGKNKYPIFEFNKLEKIHYLGLNDINQINDLLNTNLPQKNYLLGLIRK